MSDPYQEEVISIVNSLFEVTQFNKGVYSLEFRIEDDNFKSKFEYLARKLEGINYVCKIEQMENGKYIIIQRFPVKKQRKWLNASWIPRILFGIVVTFVMIDGYYRTINLNKIDFINLGDPYYVAGIYTLSLLGILGIHESGHLIAAKVHKLKTTWPFFIPGIPYYGFLPTFGAFIQSRGLTINREILFDVAIAGPIAGLVVAIIVSLYGAYTAPMIESGLVSSEHSLIEFTMGEPLLFKGALALFGKGGEGHEVLMTPILWAAWIGFLITFLNLLPAWQLDGGHMARTLLGPKLHRYATFGSMAILVLLGYWIMAMLILIMSARNPSANPLDDISPLTKNRKMIYIGVIVLAILCAPLPANFLP
ncbi:MAG: site-2 protease family protein [Nitrosopumilus sp.]|nr:site-2 protease family protein [Nitrosopumilus sp.]